MPKTDKNSILSADNRNEGCKDNLSMKNNQVGEPTTFNLVDVLEWI